MKKVLLVLAVAGTIAACNDSGVASAKKADSASVSSPAPVVADSTSHRADSTKTADSTATKHDSSAKK